MAASGTSRKGDSVKSSATSDCIDEDSGRALVLCGKPPVVPTDRGLSAVYSPDWMMGWFASFGEWGISGPAPHQKRLPNDRRRRFREILILDLGLCGWHWRSRRQAVVLRRLPKQCVYSKG